MKKIFYVMSAMLTMTLAFCFVNEEGHSDVSAESVLTADTSQAEADPSCQFYYSDDTEFFIDGIKVFYGDEDVTDNSVIYFNTTPETTYDGTNNDYTVAFTAEYEDMSCEGMVDVKIGLRGDANCDGKLTLNDAVLIENEVLQNYNASKSALAANDGFGIFLANADGRMRTSSHKLYGLNDLNIGDAFFISSYLGSGNKGTFYDNVLLKNAAKPKNGNISITSAQGMPGDTVVVYVYENCERSLGAFDFECSWTGEGLELIGTDSTRSSLYTGRAVKGQSAEIWGYGKSSLVGDGRIAALKFQIPYSATPGDTYNIGVSTINYFGAGADISDYVTVSDGTITVTNTPSLFNPRYINYIPDLSGDYDAGVKVWDREVPYGTKSVQLPVMLLGGVKEESFYINVKCDAPLSINELKNAESYTGGGNEIKGIYINEDSGLKLDFETLTVNIGDNAVPGTYPVSIQVSGMESPGVIKTFDGSITIADKSYVFGDANEDGKMNVQDAAFIAAKLARGQGSQICYLADYNEDNKINVVDAAKIARKLAGK